MPSVKIPRKSSDTDMTPFVDVAFLILSFFMLATKFKPPEAVDITTPSSVSSKELEPKDAMMVTIDPKGRVFFSIQVEDAKSASVIKSVITNLNTTRSLGLTDAEINTFINDANVGVPFAKLKPYLALNEEQRKTYKQEGVPVMDTLNNELYFWIRDTYSAFSGKKLNFLIKGDNKSTYPVFKNVIWAFKRNDILKYFLVTAPEDVPSDSDIAKKRKEEAAAGAGK
jgi:biopolymer transport protein ExbD